MNAPKVERWKRDYPKALVRDALRPVIWAAVNDGMTVDDALDMAISAISSMTTLVQEG